MKLTKDTEVWVPKEKHHNKKHVRNETTNAALYEHGVVAADQKSKRIYVKLSESRKTISTKSAFPINPRLEPDMTSLWHIHEPGIMHNIISRASQDEPYTFMGPVLVAMNPLKSLPEPRNTLGARTAINNPHPYAVAEHAIQQLQFSKQSQSVVVSGESGAGKTESSKMVLRHLVARLNEEDSRSSLDLKLLASNPILEAFGNAATVRNHNSSRFGKFLKLNLNKKHELVGASVETYLLERSRVTNHQPGERAYHIYYLLLLGLTKEKRKKWGLEAGPKGFRYTVSSSGTGERLPVKSNPADDFFETSVARFSELCEALDRFGLHEKYQDQVFRAIASILHLGNIQFGSGANDAATIKEKSKTSLKMAAKLLEVSVPRLSTALCQRLISVPGGGETVAFRNATTAKFARDAIARALYCRTFDWLVENISQFLSPQTPSSGDAEGLSIGVLDIFGFESFEHNSLEQLLINYTNESLQSTYEKQVFEAEADLFRKEGLVVDESQDMVDPIRSNESCMVLLRGALSSSQPASIAFGSGVTTNSGGLLGIVDAQSLLPQASDVKLVAKVHTELTGKECFGKVHPKDRNLAFVVEHFAGPVTYTIGSFILKNSDHLPAEADLCVLTSTSSIVTKIWRTGLKPSASSQTNTKRPPKIDIHSMHQSKGGFRNKQTKKTVVSKFRVQIKNLMDTLDSTRCWFIRCIKPNAEMTRTKNSNTWLNEQYICGQLRCLSVPQTAALLKQGFPTRIEYSQLTQLYTKLLPKRCIKSWKILGQEKPREFVAGLFYAFKVANSDFKLGTTRAFFRAGKLEELNKILEQPKAWKKSKKKSKDEQRIVKRFTHYHARRRWRAALVKVSTINAFRHLGDTAKSRDKAAKKIQRWYRSSLLGRRMQESATRIQAAFRGIRSRLILKREASAEAERKAKEARARARQARKARKESAKKLESIRNKQIRARKLRRKQEEEARKRLNKKEKLRAAAATSETAAQPAPEPEENEKTKKGKKGKNKNGTKARRERADGVSDVVWCLHEDCFESPCFFPGDEELDEHTRLRHAEVGPKNLPMDDKQDLSLEELRQRKEQLRRSIHRKSISLRPPAPGGHAPPKELKDLIAAAIEQDYAHLSWIEAKEVLKRLDRDAEIRRLQQRGRSSLKRATAAKSRQLEQARGVRGRRGARPVVGLAEEEALAALRQELFENIVQQVEREGGGLRGRQTSAGRLSDRQVWDDSALSWSRRGSLELRAGRPRRLSASSLLGSEHEAEADQLVHGWVCELDAQNQRRWVKRYAVFDPQHLSISYYKAKPAALEAELGLMSLGMSAGPAVERGESAKAKGVFYLQPLLRPSVKEHDRLPKKVPELPESLKRGRWEKAAVKWKRGSRDEDVEELRSITYLQITGGRSSRAEVLDTVLPQGRSNGSFPGKVFAGSGGSIRRGLTRGKSLSRASGWFGKGQQQQPGRAGSKGRKWNAEGDDAPNRLMLAFDDANQRSEWARALRAALKIDSPPLSKKSARAVRKKKQQGGNGTPSTLVLEALGEFDNLQQLHQNGTINEETFRELVQGVADVSSSSNGETDSELSSDEELVHDKDTVESNVKEVQKLLDELSDFGKSSKLGTKTSSFSWSVPKVPKFHWPSSPLRRKLGSST